MCEDDNVGRFYERSFESREDPAPLALDKHDRHGGKYQHGDDQRHDNNNKYGFINTIVDQNNRFKLTESKFDRMMNNQANANQLQEMVEKHNEGTPRPHKSWREFV